MSLTFLGPWGGSWWVAVWLALALTCACPVQAKEAIPLGDEPWVEARMVHISEELRCLVCQNETLASSRADLAKDLRDEVRGLIRQGKTDAEIQADLVARYGDFVLYRPEVKPTTWALGWGPLLGLGLSLAWLALRARRAKPTVSPAPMALSDEAQRLVDAVLQDRDGI